MNSATITSKGQVTIPVSVRTAFNLGPGDKLIFVPQGDRIIAFPVKRRPLTEFAGIFRVDAPVPDTDQLRSRVGETLGTEMLSEDAES